MKKRHLLTTLLLVGTVMFAAACGGNIEESKANNNGSEESSTSPKVEIKTEDIVVEKSTKGNPIAGFNDSGILTYGGDPAALVVGDTVYLYTGHDTPAVGNEVYTIPEYQCYSSKDMVEWTYEGVIMKCRDIGWADNNSAWAAQVAVHYDAKAGKDMYYLYYCSWDSTDNGKQSIGVAISESPTGPFTDIGHSMIKGSFTQNESSTWNDIDPTIWIENDENGEEHRYLAWGNGKYYICELNEDMISVKDLDGDGEITFGKDVLEKQTPESYTEAPWLYRQRDEDGNPYGPYYLFYAYGWREQMAYATTDDLINGEWEFGSIIMEPTATSDTNHMSVFDFGGKTYFIYHNGSLPGGSGYRRVACVSEMIINEDGTVNYIQETSTGISGTAVNITTKDGDKVAHAHFSNSSDGGSYPYKDISVGTSFTVVNRAEDADFLWEIVPGLSDKDNENYVSIESYNKPGLYITASAAGRIGLSQDSAKNLSAQQTFKTVKGLSGDGVSFESVAYPGYFITLNSSGDLALREGTDADACTFYISE